MNSEKVVYRHCNPNTLEVFYVGSGDSKRPFSKCRSTAWKEYVLKNGNPLIEIVATNLDKDTALELEELMTEMYGRVFEGGSLVNMLSGIRSLK